MKISVCIIEKNEENVLERCLQGAALFADEIIVLDTGSSDSSREIALRYTDKVFDYVWKDDFAAARNASFEKASGDYIMWLDADDVVDAENAAKLSGLKETLRGSTALLMPYERPEHGCVFYYLRMVKRRTDKKPYWHGIIHEQLIADGPVQFADILIRHAKMGTLDYERNIRMMEKLSAEDLKNDFYLCCQCFLDCCLAGKKELSDYYYSFCDDSGDFDVKAAQYLPVCNVLAWHRKDKDVLRWTELAWRDFQRHPVHKDIMCRLLSDGLKAAERQGNFQMSETMNSRVLELDPENPAALTNRHSLHRVMAQIGAENIKIFDSIISAFADK